MSDIVLKVENLWKQYRLGVVGVGSLREDVGRWMAKLRGKDDPTLKVGETNDRENIKGDYVWALQDINFEIKTGEVVGIIGKNGAGKSTLLKILSKVTTPTKGSIKVKGRIASLLEVGTGFHPELTGRENIFLNGAILGMTKNDIRSKFDEIVDFSGIGKYIDTPVKRYSSGMYVRLAFAVAAHLEPEILIVDEVLAVGDADFQKKCLGKMQDVSQKGRTVLFVSHNMSMLKSLCSRGIYLQNGKVFMEDSINKTVDTYLAWGQKQLGERTWDNTKKPSINDMLEVQHVVLKNTDGNISVNYDVKENIYIEIVYKILKTSYCYQVHFYLRNQEGIRVFVAIDNKYSPYTEIPQEEGTFREVCIIPKNLLNEGTYFLEALICTCPTNKDYFVTIPDVLSFQITDDMNSEGVRGNWFREWPEAMIRYNFDWNIQKIS